MELKKGNLCVCIPNFPQVSVVILCTAGEEVFGNGERVLSYQIQTHVSFSLMVSFGESCIKALRCNLLILKKTLLFASRVVTN